MEIEKEKEEELSKKEEPKDSQSISNLPNTMETNLNHLLELEKSPEYYKGRLALKLSTFIEGVKEIASSNNKYEIWSSLIKEYFSQEGIFSYVITREGTSFSYSKFLFNSLDCRYEVLPSLFTAKFDDDVLLTAFELNQLSELQNSKDGKYILIIDDCNFAETYLENNNLVVINGKIRIVFNKEYKFEIFEIINSYHEEYSAKDNYYKMVNDLGITPQFSRALISCQVLTDNFSHITRYAGKYDDSKISPKD